MGRWLRWRGSLGLRRRPCLRRLQQAEQTALQNHPQIQAAQHEAAYSSQQIVINRAALYPQITGDLTGSQGNDNARIAAGSLAASRLFDRLGAGAAVQQLITDSGRTPALIASARLQAQASQQDVATPRRYDVLLAVNRMRDFDVLRAQAVVKVAEKQWKPGRLWTTRSRSWRAVISGPNWTLPRPTSRSINRNSCCSPRRKRWRNRRRNWAWSWARTRHPVIS